jgi:hypothetical protein
MKSTLLHGKPRKRPKITRSTIPSDDNTVQPLISIIMSNHSKCMCKWEDDCESIQQGIQEHALKMMCGVVHASKMILKRRLGAPNELPHLQTSFWHCNMLLRNYDIDMTFVSQNFRVFPRAMSLVPEVCPISQNTSHTYVSTCHI